MRARVDLGYGDGGYCQVRAAPCPPACGALYKRRILAGHRPPCAEVPAGGVLDGAALDRWAGVLRHLAESRRGLAPEDAREVLLAFLSAVRGGGLRVAEGPVGVFVGAAMERCGLRVEGVRR